LILEAVILVGYRSLELRNVEGAPDRH